MRMVTNNWLDYLNMKQKTNQRLFRYWDEVRNGRPAPRRYEIEPLRITGLLPETFISEVEGPGTHKFRLAGTKVCQFFGRELKGTNLLDLWVENDRRSIETLLNAISEEACVGLVHYKTETAGYRDTIFELLLLPLCHTNNLIDRILGGISTNESQLWFGATGPFKVSVLDIKFFSPNQASTNMPRQNY